MRLPEIAILHYSAPPVIGGVEAVIEAHARLFLDSGYSLTLITGEGDASAFPKEANFVQIAEMSSQHPTVLRQNQLLMSGKVPDDFERLVEELEIRLTPFLKNVDISILHNLFTKHFNLALTVALHRMIDKRVIKNCIAWCHDFTWTSANSRSAVYPGYPWDLLRTPRPEVRYVVVSKSRRQELAGLFDYPPEGIEVVYNGVDPASLLGLSTQGLKLVNRLGLIESDLVLLMPVRVTKAKNIEYAMQLVAILKEQIHIRLLVTGPPDPHDEQSMAYFDHLMAMRRDLDIEEQMRFIFNSGDHATDPMFIDLRIVGELYRLSDLLLMPSHREGFGMPVLEAGLLGIPVVTTDIPSAVEIGGEDVILFDAAREPAWLADRILEWTDQSPVYRMRRRVRQGYTWHAIFNQQIKPLIDHKDWRRDALQ